jgi:hypothetical protein
MVCIYILRLPRRTPLTSASVVLGKHLALIFLVRKDKGNKGIDAQEGFTGD